jgi:hypothetical protein
LCSARLRVGLRSFPTHLLWDVYVQLLLGKQLLEAGVLLLELPQALRFAGAHPAILVLPAVEGSLAYTQLASRRWDGRGSGELALGLAELSHYTTSTPARVANLRLGVISEKLSVRETIEFRKYGTCYIFDYLDLLRREVLLPATRMCSSIKLPTSFRCIRNPLPFMFFNCSPKLRLIYFYPESCVHISKSAERVSSEILVPNECITAVMSIISSLRLRHFSKVVFG